MKKTNSIGRLHGWFFIATASLCAIAQVARADYRAAVIGDTPLAFYPLDLSVDTSGTATDVSGNGNDGSYVNIFSGYNNATGPSGFITNAVSFDGYDTSVDLSSAPNLSFTGPAALEAWIRPADSTSFGDIIGKGYDSSTYQEIFLRENGPYGANFTGGFGNANATGGQQNTNWMHIVLANNGSSTTLYINGVAVSSASDTTGAINFSDPWAIGNGSSAGNGRHFNGLISQVAIYSHGLSAAQVLNHYFVGLIGISPSNAVPLITAQPQQQATYVNGTVTFSVSALSPLTTTYQWYKDATQLNGMTNSTLTLKNVQSGDVANYSVAIHNVNGTTNSTSASITLMTPGDPLQWAVSGNTGTWDTGSSANWINLNTSAQVVFNTTDSVLFDDTTGVPTTVTVSGSVSPSIMTVNSSANNYSLTGSGSITGPGSLVKLGASTLSLNVPGNFTGQANVGGGTLQTVGNNTLGSVSSINVSNGATLDFDGQTMTGNQTVNVNGTGAGGIGALYNSSGGIYGNVLSINLRGDTKFGAASRWDLGAGSQISGPHSATLDWNGSGYGEWNTVSVGPDVVGFTVTNGNIGMKYMDNGFQNPATLFTVSPGDQLIFWNGGFNGSIHLLSGAIAYLWTAPSALNGANVILEDNAQWDSWGSSGTPEPVNSAITLNGVAHFVIGDHNMVYTNLVSGPGGFVSDYWNHQTVFSVSNTYSGPTIIGDGPQVALVGNGSITHSALIFFGGSNSNSVHVDAGARTDSTLTLAAGQTLGGIGAVAGNLVETSGATIAPAGTNTTITITTGSNPAGAITATGNITLSGTTTLKLVGPGASDLLIAGGNVTCGGTLNLVNISGTALAAGNSFQILKAGGSLTGSFSISPSTPGSGLAWDTTQLSSGIVQVASATAPVIGSVRATGGSIIFSGTGGSASGSYNVLTSTNLATPIANWTVIATNNFDGSGNFNVTSTITAGTYQQFYRIK